MPMSFPDLKTLRAHFDHPKSLPYYEGESEATYRERCAVWSEEVWSDYVQAHEIRTSKGWDQWNEDEQLALLRDMSKRQGGS